MKFLCIGHDRETAVRDMLISLLPDEKHEITSEDICADGLCRTSATEKDGTVFAKAELFIEGGVFTGECTEKLSDRSDVENKRAVSFAVKTALYKALVKILPQRPPWGSLTGVKPAKPARFFMAEGGTKKECEEWLKDRYFVSEKRAKLCVEAAAYALSAERSLKKREVQLYVGIPFCPSKCLYCSFVSNDVKSWGHLIEPYFNALLSEIEAVGGMFYREGLSVGSVYIGGGTPTVLSADGLKELIERIKGSFDLSGCREFTVEAGRPDTINKDKLKVFDRLGISRISINPQSMNDGVLIASGRRHTAEDVRRAYALARETGRFTVNMDLIAGLPSDDGEGLLKSTEELISMGPENITVHCLARKKGAPLRFGARGELKEEELDACHDLLISAGYEPYYLYRQKYSAGGLENVGFCREGLASFYNICMMEEIGDTVALGSGGISKLQPEKDGKIVRICNPKYPLEYIERIGTIRDKKSKICF